MLRIFLASLLFATKAQACQTALILAMDVSQSVDVGEFRIQKDGLALALRDPEIVETLVRDEIALSVIQWSGADKQEVSIDWARMRSALHVANFAARVETLERAFTLSDTAPAEAIRFAMRRFEQVPDCHRRVIDVSGDGTPNAGADVRQMRAQAQRVRITINGLAIEGMGVAVTNFYRRHLITRDGFVETARGYRDYARAIREKILREISRVLF
ncbi:DUF1194 domain-containing protein [Pacificoceanicola onchidii]|uniref:DUF1194 domain-containing protein n=1 Tax=Pacificoceanicola onchidii TaxID=2562685 RepID=UPI0010A335AD|nr:DUF1194 domain-containing protein [Pacificoceanicola onchidii]